MDNNSNLLSSFCIQRSINQDSNLLYIYHISTINFLMDRKLDVLEILQRLAVTRDTGNNGGFVN